MPDRLHGQMPNSTTAQVCGCWSVCACVFVCHHGIIEWWWVCVYMYVCVCVCVCVCVRQRKRGCATDGLDVLKGGGVWYITQLPAMLLNISDCLLETHRCACQPNQASPIVSKILRDTDIHNDPISIHQAACCQRGGLLGRKSFTPILWHGWSRRMERRTSTTSKATSRALPLRIAGFLCCYCLFNIHGIHDHHHSDSPWSSHLQ